MTADPLKVRRDRRQRQRSRRVARRRAVFAGVVLVAIGAIVAWSLENSGRHSIHAQPQRSPAQSPTAAVAGAAPPNAGTLVERPAGRLPSALQDAAAASSGRRIVLLAGLSAAGTSTDGIRIVTGSRTTVAGRLPVALHDAAAASVAGGVFMFGGGDGTSQLDTIRRVDPSTGANSVVGRLPVPNSDLAAATVAGTVYLIGGFTGSRWLDTIVSWRPGSTARVVAHLPRAIRYAAAAAVDGRIVIAGGSSEQGAGRAVVVFDPAGGSVRSIGRLPSATTHAAAATLGHVVYVIGGRRASGGTATDRIVAVDAASRRVRMAGHLSSPRSDLAAITLGERIMLLGGRGLRGTTSAIGALSLTAVTAPSATTAAPEGNVYANDGPNMFSPAVRGVPLRIYVPNSKSNTVDVIDPRTGRVIRHFAVGGLPQHVTPSWDLKTLFVLNDQGNSVTPIDPMTSRPGRPIPVDDPYNMYFTPDGRFAIVVAERKARLDFRDPHTMALRHSLSVPCRGVDHMDFTADGRRLLASCEFSGQVLEVDVAAQRVVRTVTLGFGAMPQDVKLSPDGAVFYVADMMGGGLYLVDARSFKRVGFLPTGRGAHGLYPSRDAKLMYVSNRGEGSISVVDFATRRVVTKWRLPGGGSPDMGGVSPDGATLWLSGRYNNVVYAIDTRTGRLKARIPVGSGPHGLSVWPQPGRYSLGHTGILR